MNLPLSEIATTIDVLRACGYEDVIATCEVADVLAYCDALAKAASDAQAEQDNAKANALALLAVACQPILEASAPDEPFRQLRPGDFSEEQYSVLAQFAPEVDAAELKARLADLVWVKTKDADMARVAVGAYILSGQNANLARMWVDGVARIERALRIGTQLRDEGRIKNAVDALLAALSELETVEDNGRSLSGAQYIGELLLDQRREDPKRLAERAENWAQKAESRGDYWLKSKLLEFAARALSRAREYELSRSRCVAAAEALVDLSDDEERAENKLVAHSWLQEAIEKLQKCGGCHDRMEELKGKLAGLGLAGLSELRRIEIPLDMAAMASASVETVRDKDPLTALCLFANIVEPAQRKILENQAMACAKADPLKHNMTKTVYNGDGRVVARVPPLFSSSGEDKSLAIKGGCCEQARMHFLKAVGGKILPARNEIMRQHASVIDERLLAEYLRDSGIFAPGRQALWIKGFLAGFQGDYVVSLSVLMPQFEHGLRKLLEKRGAVVYGIKNTGIHSEKLLDDLLGMVESLTLLGEDLQFELQCLLTERVGVNLRNELAHGLLSEDAFLSVPAVYVWWLFFHIAVALTNRGSTQLP